MTSWSSMTIQRVSLDERPRALRFLLPDVSETLWPSDLNRPDDIWLWARNGDRVWGVAWAQLTTSEIATLVPPRLADDAPISLRRELLVQLEHHISRRGRLR